MKIRKLSAIKIPPSTINYINRRTCVNNNDSEVIAKIIQEEFPDTSLEDLAAVPNYIEVAPIVGQLSGTYDEYTELLVNMKYKFYRNGYEDSKGRTVVQYVSTITDVVVDTEPGTVVSLEVSETEEFERFVVNETGVIHFDPFIFYCLFIEIIKIQSIWSQSVGSI